MITAAHSRFMLGRMIPTRTTEDLLLGIVGADPAAGPGAAPADLGQRAGHRPRPAPRRGGGGVHGHPGDQAGAAAAAGPGVQGDRGAAQRLVRDLVHARPDLRLAGRLQRPVHRLAGDGERRVVRTIKARPVDLLEADRAAMLPLPPVPPHLGWRNRVRLGRDYYVRVDTNDYSVDPTAIGRMVDVTRRPGPGPGPRSTGGSSPTTPGSGPAGMTVTDPAHVRDRRRAARSEFQQPRGHGPASRRPGPDLADYDRAFGLDEEVDLMAAKTTTDAVKQINYLAAALKAPRITEAAARLADQARDAGWTHEDYLAAVLEREVSARNASGAELRIRAAGFPARKTLEDFDFDAQPAVRQPDRRPGLRRRS